MEKGEQRERERVAGWMSSVHKRLVKCLKLKSGDLAAIDLN